MSKTTAILPADSVQMAKLIAEMIAEMIERMRQAAYDEGYFDALSTVTEKVA